VLGSIALVIGGVAAAAAGLYLWRNPEFYYRYLHSTSLLATFCERPPLLFVKFGAALSIAAGAGVIVYGLYTLLD
jgi:hypothetical protein